MNEYKYIVRESGICGGRPTIKGTRLEVHWLVMYITEDGISKIEDSKQNLIEDYSLTQEQIEEALAYFAIEMSMDEILKYISEDMKD